MKWLAVVVLSLQFGEFGASSAAVMPIGLTPLLPWPAELDRGLFEARPVTADQLRLGSGVVRIEARPPLDQERGARGPQRSQPDKHVPR